MKTEPQKEHLWLNKLLGEWTTEMPAPGDSNRSAQGPRVCASSATCGCCARAVVRCLVAESRTC